jgi:lactoylglutathione lyase
MNIKRVGNVILTVKDMGKSVEFYNKILGMPIKRERDNWIDLGQTGALLSLRPISTSKSNVNTSTDNGILIGFVVGDVSSVIDELKLKNVKIHRDIQDKSSGKNAIILDPDGYMISLFEPSFSAEKTIQSGGYIGFTPA